MLDAFGTRVRRMRHERNWSQQELSLRSGISTPHISSIERSKRFPSLEYGLRIAASLGVPIHALCDETDFQPLRMRKSQDQLPLHLQSFILREESTPYLQVAHRMSSLPREDSELLTLMIDLLFQKRRLDPTVVNLLPAKELKV